MPHVVFSPAISAFQVDDFGVGVERSVKGSLHVSPGSSLSLTAGELDHLQRKHPGLLLGAVVAQDPAPAASPEAPKVAPKEEEAPALEEAMASAPTPSPHPKRRHNS